MKFGRKILAELVRIRGSDVVWGIDPFKQDPPSDDDDLPTNENDGVAPRPSLIIRNESGRWNILTSFSLTFRLLSFIPLLVFLPHSES